MRARAILYGILMVALLAIVLIFIRVFLWSGCGIWRIPC